MTAAGVAGRTLRCQRRCPRRSCNDATYNVSHSARRRPCLSMSSINSSVAAPSHALTLSMQRAASSQHKDRRTRCCCCCCCCCTETVMPTCAASDTTCIYDGIAWRSLYGHHSLAAMITRAATSCCINAVGHHRSLMVSVTPRSPYCIRIRGQQQLRRHAVYTTCNSWICKHPSQDNSAAQPGAAALRQCGRRWW